MPAKLQLRVIEASAGTGKTHHLTQYFLSLVDKNHPARSLPKIMAVTFSDKAAIEMKERILRKMSLLTESLDDWGRLEMENALLRLRVSTIHSFCRSLLQRFSFHLKIDPFFTVVEEEEARRLFDEAVSSYLSQPRPGRALLSLTKHLSLPSLVNLWQQFYRCHPHTFIGQPRPEVLTSQVFALYREIKSLHNELKRERSGLDFNDLECLSYLLLTQNPSAMVVLEDFDENICFLLVDEFQDINLLQWEIIRALSEEWLSGQGARAESGSSYGLFLVGDRKQSIYGFRGAESDIFDRALDFLGNQVERETLSVSQRSSPEVINFINRLFENTSPWDTQKLEPNPSLFFTRENSAVEICLFPEATDKERELEWVASRICHLVRSGALVHQRDGSTRPITFRDIAILMRRRGPALPLLEKTLRASGIPFLVLGGIGFYQEPEIRFLLSLIFALADPTDEMACWNLKYNHFPVDTENLAAWRQKLSGTSLPVLMEEILKELKFGLELSTQQQANVEKFLSLLEMKPSLSLFEVAQNLRRACRSVTEPKADIFSEGENAVRLMTIHAAKGLEFPAVFLIGLEEGRLSEHSQLLYEKNLSGQSPYFFVLKRETSPEERKLFAQMLAPEEQRVFYVAVTRASQYLFLSGIEKRNSPWIFQVKPVAADYPPLAAETVSVCALAEHGPPTRVEKLPVSFPATVTSFSRIEAPASDFWWTRTGELLHRILCEVSRGKLPWQASAIWQRLNFYCGKGPWRKRMFWSKYLRRTLKRLLANPQVTAIVLPRPGSLAEVPFVVDDNGRIIHGTIDRIIVEGQTVHVYDYKLSAGRAESQRQMNLYLTAARKIFPGYQITGTLVILDEGRLVPVAE
ncbi:MAG TPA: UvrD-helicase domain-containing protein [bacterium]|nr:UvrD-helicase domain-containing protein [bacterium]HPP11373.1 UvrD-helicase domain-containing protein [bacterium]